MMFNAIFLITFAAFTVTIAHSQRTYEDGTDLGHAMTLCDQHRHDLRRYDSGYEGCQDVHNQWRKRLEDAARVAHVPGPPAAALTTPEGDPDKAVINDFIRKPR